MYPKNLYVSKTHIGNGEYSIEGKTASGELKFGFRCFMDGFCSWMDKARAYTPSGYICVFDKPVAVLK